MNDERETFVTDHATGQLCLRRVVLEVAEGPDKGTTLALPGHTVLVGSGSGTDLRLTDRNVSRRHLEIAVVDDGVRVVDSGSKNGTFANGVKIEQAVVQPGTTVRIGDTTLALRAIDEPVDVGQRDKLGGLVGRSGAMRALFALLARAAQSRATVLIEGETGTGKEEIARALHLESPWKKQPFVVFDCGATSPSLIASELFGHKKGAFTGATDDRPGLFEEAKGGTLFLDEIGELPMDLQPSLLRVLEARQVRRVGENRVRDVDVRVVAATNRDLLGEIERGRFRSDLYYRLALLQVRVPPLRERLEDLELIAERLFAKAGAASRKLTSAELATLRAHHWPGNVRELKNAVEHAAALGGPIVVGAGPASPTASPTAKPAAPAASAGAGGSGAGGSGGAADPGDDVDVARPYREARGEAIAQFERSYVVKLLKEHGGNVSQAARAAGVDRNWLHRLMKRYSIERAEIS